MAYTCYIPTLSAGADSGALFQLAREIDGQAKVVFNFGRCYFLSPEGVAFLGGLARLIQQRGGLVFFEWSSLSAAVRAHLAQNGFMKAFDGPASPWRGNSVPFFEHRQMNPGGFSTYIQDSWLGRGWLGMSELLANQITGNVSEIYVNAFEHAGSPIGIYCCGQHFPRLKVLSLTMVDFGVGVPFNVRRFKASEVGHRRLGAGQCLEWAFQPGTSTRSGGASGGIGLHNLCQFVKVNGGSFDFYSHEGHACLRKGVVTFSERVNFFCGTMATVKLRCDDRYYLLGSELPSLNPFQS